MFAALCQCGCSYEGEFEGCRQATIFRLLGTLPGKDVNFFQNHITKLKSTNTNCNITLCHQLWHNARIRSNPCMIKTNERFIGLLWLKAGMQKR
jgi:hypothetical protein